MICYWNYKFILDLLFCRLIFLYFVNNFGEYKLIVGFVFIGDKLLRGDLNIFLC